MQNNFVKYKETTKQIGDAIFTHIWWKLIHDGTCGCYGNCDCYKDKGKEIGSYHRFYHNLMKHEFEFKKGFDDPWECMCNYVQLNNKSDIYNYCKDNDLRFEINEEHPTVTVANIVKQLKETEEI